MMALFFISTEWQLLSSLTALATSTSPESTAKDPWTEGRLLVLELLYYINDASPSIAPHPDDDDCC